MCARGFWSSDVYSSAPRATFLGVMRAWSARGLLFARQVGEGGYKKEGGRPPDGLCHSPWRVSRGQRRPSGSFGLQGFPGGRGLGGKPLILGAPGWGAFFPRTRGRRWLRGGGGSRESGRCLPALTLVARQGGGLGTELSEHSVHAPLEVQIHIWAAGWGSFEAGSPWPYPRSHLHSP